MHFATFPEAAGGPRPPATRCTHAQVRGMSDPTPHAIAARLGTLPHYRVPVRPRTTQKKQQASAPKTQRSTQNPKSPRQRPPDKAFVKHVPWQRHPIVSSSSRRPRRSTRNHHGPRPRRHPRNRGLRAELRQCAQGRPQIRTSRQLARRAPRRRRRGRPGGRTSSAEDASDAAVKCGYSTFARDDAGRVGTTRWRDGKG